MKKLIIYLPFLLLFMACEQEDVSTLETETAVVKAYLFAGQPLDSIKIRQSISNASEDSVAIAIENVDVTISTDTETYPLEHVGMGVYQNLNVLVDVNQSYSLEFEHNEEVISAETYVPDFREATISTTEITMDKIEAGTMPNFGELPDPIELEWDNSEGEYYYVVVQNIEDDPESINELFEGGGRAFRFTSEPQAMDFYAIDPRRELQQFGMHQIIVFRVNPEYAALYETSGTTSTTIAQPPTNIENGLGIFTGVSSDTLLLNVKKG